MHLGCTYRLVVTDGGPTGWCQRDGVATRLSCGRCGRPVCPRCMVLTRVGVRCDGHPEGNVQRYRPPAATPFGVGGRGLWVLLLFPATLVLPVILGTGGGAGLPVLAVLAGLAIGTGALVLARRRRRRRRR